MSDAVEMIEALRNEARCLHGVASRDTRGGQETTLSAHLAEKAADLIEELEHDNYVLDQVSKEQVIGLRATEAQRDKLWDALEALISAANAVEDHKASTYRTRNGRDVGIEADDGEKCFIIHSDYIDALRDAARAAIAISKSQEAADG